MYRSVKSHLRSNTPNELGDTVTGVSAFNLCIALNTYYLLVIDYYCMYFIHGCSRFMYDIKCNN